MSLIRLVLSLTLHIKTCSPFGQLEGLIISILTLRYTDCACSVHAIIDLEKNFKLHFMAIVMSMVFVSFIL